jgi:DNA-binding transcriptional ArsR family regulator
MDSHSVDAEIHEMAVKQAAFCDAFGNPTRVLILWTLGDREMSVGSIALAIKASLQNTSQHLRLMKDKGILVSRREGQKVYYRLAENELMQNCQLVIQARQIEALRAKQAASS